MPDKKNDLQGKTIAVTGATGLVGSHMVAELLQHGYSPRLIVRDRNRLPKLVQTLKLFGLENKIETLEVQETELNNPITLAEAMRGTDLLFNCAATVSFDPRGDEELIRSNTELANHIVNTSIEQKIKLIHISSIATLGPASPGRQYVTEDCLIESLERKSAYAANKFYAENEVWRGIWQGLEAVIVNPSVILGEGDWEQSSSRLIAFGVGNPFYTTGIKGYVDVRDVAKATVLLAGSDQAIGRRFLLSGSNLSFQQLFTMINTAAGKRPPGIKSSETLLRLASAGESLVSRLTGKPRGLSPETIANAIENTLYDGGLVTKTVNFEYTPVEETIHRVTKQYLVDKKLS